MNKIKKQSELSLITYFYIHIKGRKKSQYKPNTIMTNTKVQHLFSQIESIKSTMSMKNGNKPELWVQRQNLQDLYHQIILK